MKNTLWQGTLSDLVTSRRTWVNAMYAMPIYGVPAPTVLDAEGFGAIELPADRSGLLTLAPFLTASSRSNGTGTSVVGRGIAVLSTLVCSPPPTFPESDPEIVEIIESQETWSEKQKADFRSDPVTGSKCVGCHLDFATA
jgi:hypothetical protein